MLEVNEPILVDDPNRLLRYERGVFELVSPSGKCMRVICPLDHLPEQAWAQCGERFRGWWKVKKIAL